MMMYSKVNGQTDLYKSPRCYSRGNITRIAVNKYIFSRNIETQGERVCDGPAEGSIGL